MFSRSPKPPPEPLPPLSPHMVTLYGTPPKRVEKNLFWRIFDWIFRLP